MEQDHWQTQLLRVFLIGDSGVGKSSLVRWECYKKHDKEIPPTTLATLFDKQTEVDNLKVSMAIWDTAASMRGLGIDTNVYTNADGCVLVYDSRNAKSFESLDGWMREFLAEVEDPEDFPFVLVGNKYDASEKQAVSDEKALTWCKSKNGIPFYKTSAATGDNVEMAFQGIARAALKDDTPAVKRAKKFIRDEGERIRFLQEEGDEEYEEIGLVYEDDGTQVAVAIATVERAKKEKNDAIFEDAFPLSGPAAQASGSSSGHVA